jgi:dipeptidyl aminopeptidase/acylaminoacyl peptidase
MRKTVTAVFAVFFLITQGAFAQTTPSEIPAEWFAALPKNSNVRLSPDGKHFSIVSFINGTRYVVITPLGGKPLTAIPPYKGFSIGWADWANDETLLISMSGEKEAHSAFGKITVNRLISYNINGGKPKDMAKPAKVKGSRDKNRTYMANYSLILDWMHEDPDFILLMIDEDGTDAALEVRKVNVKSGNYKLVMDFYGPVQRWMTDQQNVIRFGRGMERKNQTADGEVVVMYYVNPETGNFEKHEQHPSKKFSVRAFFEDSRYAYVIDQNEDGFSVLYKFDMVNWERVEIIFEVEGYNVGSLIEDQYTDKPIGTNYMDDGGSKIHYFDPFFAKIHRMMNKALPGTEISITSYNKARNLFVIHATSDIEPGAYYLFDYSAKNLAFMEGAYEGLDPRQMSPMQEISYEARDGLIIPGYLTIPLGSDGKNLPTIILPHGGPEARDYWGYDFLPQFFASRGYAVLQPNFRGSDGYSKDFAGAGRKQWGLKMQDDVTDGALWMIEQGIADPERMCIMGWSYGGYVALTATFNTPDLYKCSISVNGVSDLPAILYQDSNFLGASYWKRHIGEDKEQNKQTSAIYNIDKIRMPVLVIANRDDPTVDYKQSTSFVKKMKGAGKSVLYFEIKEGGHGALEGVGRAVILIEAEKFLAKYIGGGS